MVSEMLTTSQFCSIEIVSKRKNNNIASFSILVLPVTDDSGAFLERVLVGMVSSSNNSKFMYWPGENGSTLFKGKATTLNKKQVQFSLGKVN